MHRACCCSFMQSITNAESFLLSVPSQTQTGRIPLTAAEKIWEPHKSVHYQTAMFMFKDATTRKYK